MAQVLGVERSAGTTALVMELVEATIAQAATDELSRRDVGLRIAPWRPPMSTRPFRRGAVVAAAVLALAPWLARPAAGQERPAAALDLSLGWVGFADDGIVSEALAGGAARIYVSPRVAIGPELVVIAGDRHSHLVLTGNVTFDLIAPASGRPARVTPFLVVGGGLYQTRESFFGEDYTSSEGAFTAGGGVRAAVTDRVSVGLDARLGWEPHLRMGGVIGVRLGR